MRAAATTAAVALLAVIAIALSIAAMVVAAAKGGVLGGGSTAAASDALVPLAAFPVGGVRYTRQTDGTITSVQGVWWSDLPPLASEPIYTNAVDEADATPVLTGLASWQLPTDQNAMLEWLKPSPTAAIEPSTHTAYCPPGAVVTGLQLGNNNGVASAINVWCAPLGSDAAAATLGTLVANADAQTPITVASPTDVKLPSGYLTANNFLQSSGGTWADGHPLSATQTPSAAMTALPSFTSQGFLIDATACDPFNDVSPPAKPSGHDFGNGSGGFDTLQVQFTLRYYQVGKPDPVEVAIQLPALAWSGSQTNAQAQEWQFASVDPTCVVDYDASRTFTETYDDGLSSSFIGMAIKSGTFQAVPGAGGGYTPNGNCNSDSCKGNNDCTGSMLSDSKPLQITVADAAKYQYHVTACDDCGVYYWTLSLNGGAVAATHPTNYAIGAEALPTTAWAATMRQWAADSKPSVLDPVCTGIVPKLFTGENPVTEANIAENSGSAAFLTAQSKCLTRAKTLCADPSMKGDPYCACIDATPFTGLAEGIPVRCLSNGNCMIAGIRDTMMDYATADSTTQCPPTKLDVCSVLFKMDANTIVLNDLRIDCPRGSDTCPQCTVGSGTCRSNTWYYDQLPCRPKDPTTGTCGEGFTDCSSAPPPPPPSAPSDPVTLTQEQQIIVGVGAGLVLLLLAAWGVSKRAKTRGV